MKLFALLLAAFSLNISAAHAHGDPKVDPNAVVPCQKTIGFEKWLSGFQKEALSKGISPLVLENALPEMTLNSQVLQRDKAQGVFQKSFLDFSSRAVSQSRLQKGMKLMKTHQALFDRIEREFGVPAPVLISFWALETDFRTGPSGKFPILSSMTTLAYDCRRAAFFRFELLEALRMIQRGDLPQEEMVGEWAGELSGMQFTPSDYYKYAIDFDGDGRRDLVNSMPDMMASSANFLVGLGWKRGEPWLQEVRIPQSMPWQEADIQIQHPRTQWAQWGVTAAQGSLQRDDLPASLLLPMGRLGPAFLAYNNFKTYLGWNAAMVYSTTAAYFATRFAGAPTLYKGNGEVTPLTPDQVLELQQLLVRMGYDVGKVDGKLGLASRAAVKKAQLKFGLPADSYPTEELLDLMRR